MRTLLHHHALLRQALDAAVAVEGDRRQRLLGVAHRLWQWLPMADDAVHQAVQGTPVGQKWTAASQGRDRIDQVFAELYRGDPASPTHQLHFASLHDVILAYLDAHVDLVPQVHKCLDGGVDALEAELRALRAPYEHLWILPVAWAPEA